MSGRRTRRGFTVLELLVVVVVVGVLAAVAVPRLTRALSRADTRAVEATAANVARVALAASAADGAAGSVPTAVVIATALGEVVGPAGGWTAASAGGTATGSSFAFESSAGLGWLAFANRGGCAMVRFAGSVPTVRASWDAPCTAAQVQASFAAAPWTPADLPGGLVVWFDAAEPGSVQVDGTGNVNRWVDRSGNGRDAVPVAGQPRPVRVAGGQNGRDILRFPGVLRAPFVGLGQFSPFVVYRRTGDLVNPHGNVSFVLESGVLGDGANRLFQFTFADAGFGFSLPRAGGAIGPPRDAAWGVHGAVVPLGGSFEYRVNGGSAVSAASAASAPSGSPILYVGGGQSWGSFPTFLFNGEMAEVVVATTALSAENRQRLEGYLAHRWGTASALPANHPFRSAPPTR
jgi:prepilin-type N-terminal cleavage/methylation domain-containing protein